MQRGIADRASVLRKREAPRKLQNAAHPPATKDHLQNDRVMPDARIPMEALAGRLAALEVGGGPRGARLCSMGLTLLGNAVGLWEPS